MQIKDDFAFDDSVSGLKLKVEPGKKLDVLSINGRDFYFTKTGEFDGTGSFVAGTCARNAVSKTG